jgi:neutral trehalase
MWEQQNYYIIRGLRLYGYNEMADNLKALSLAAVRTYYDKWGTVFEYYDALNTTDPYVCVRSQPAL